ncbi:hypothetical protein ACROYT_G014552 [Oculina patagonica]
MCSCQLHKIYWKQFLPNVIMAKLMFDLCFTCQKNTSNLLQASNLPEAEKFECVKAQEEHLNSVQTKEELYREDQIDLDEQHEACSLSTTLHYSFDFAQQDQSDHHKIGRSIGNICQSYTLALEENLDRRFNQAAPVLEAFGIFNPTTLPAVTDPEFME